MKIKKNLRYKLNPQMKEYDSLDFKFLSHVMFTQLPNFKSKVVNTDQRGFRKNSNSSKRDIFNINNKKKTVLFLGGSAAFGVGATKDEKTIPGYLEKKTNYNVLNLAGRGYTGYQEIISLFSNLKKIERLKVRKIIVFSGINDLYLDSMSQNRYPGNFYFNTVFLRAMNKSFYSSKKIFITKLINIYLHALGDKKEYDLKNLNSKNILKFLFFKNYRKLFISKNFEKISLNEVIYRNFKIYEIFEKLFNCKVIFIFQPILKICKKPNANEKLLLNYANIYFAKQNKNLNQFLGEHSYKNHLKLIKSIASKSKIKFFDMNIFFKRKSSYKDELFVDNIHLNNEGNNLVSECIKSLLK